MKKLLASTAFAALMATSGSAFALDVGLASVAKAMCVVPTGGISPTLGFVIDANGAIPAGGNTTIVSVPNAYCTGPAKVSVSSLHGAVTTGGNAPIPAAPLGFANHIKYSATATWNLLSAAINANNTVAPVSALSAASGGPVISNLVVQASTPGTGAPLVAGSYADVLTVNIVAQ